MKRSSVAAVLLVCVASGCSVPAQQGPQVVDRERVPFGLLAPDTPPLVPPPAATRSELVTLCFVRERQLGLVARPLDSPVGLLDAVQALAEPPAEGTRSLRTALSDITIVKEARLSGGIALVDLRRGISSLGGDDQLLAVAQIVCTLTGRPGVGQVSFTLEGTPVDVPRGDGALVGGPVSRDDYATLLS